MAPKGWVLVYNQVWVGGIHPGLTKGDGMAGLQQMGSPPLRDIFYRWVLFIMSCL